MINNQMNATNNPLINHLEFPLFRKCPIESQIGNSISLNLEVLWNGQVLPLMVLYTKENSREMMFSRLFVPVDPKMINFVQNNSPLMKTLLLPLFRIMEPVSPVLLLQLQFYWCCSSYSLSLSIEEWSKESCKKKWKKKFLQSLVIILLSMKIIKINKIVCYDYI